MMRIHQAAFLLALFLCGTGVSHAQAQVDAVPVLRVFGGDANPPFNYLHEGKMTGLGADVTAELLRRAKLPATVEPYPWGRALAMTRATPNSLLFTIARTPEREGQFHWLGPVAPREVWLYRLASRPEVNPATLVDAARYRVGAVNADATLSVFRKAGFVEGANLDVTSRDGDMARKLQVGRIDLVPLNPLILDAFVSLAGMKRSELTPVLLLTREGGYFLALNKDSEPTVRDRLDAAFAEMVKDGSLERLTARWLADMPASARKKTPRATP